jgi:hypothetical protein
MIKADYTLNKKLGRLVLSATGLRRMANYLQKQYKTKGDVSIKCGIAVFDKMKTFCYDSTTGGSFKKELND